MCAHEYVHAAVGESLQYVFPSLALHYARKQFHANVHVAQELAYRGEMLFGKDFRGCHDACLESVVQGDEHGHQRHECLSAAHVALQQTVHLSAAAQVLAYLPHHALLCVGERKWQVAAVEAVECLADMPEDVSAVFAPLVGGISQYVELHVEEFFELQSEACVLQVFGVLGVMHVAHRRIPRNEPQPVGDEWRKRLRQGLADSLYHALRYLLDGA